MVDKLDVRIPWNTQFQPEFAAAYRHAGEKGLLKQSKYYAKVGDFRSYGYEVRLHMFVHFGQKRNGRSSRAHKLELYDTAEMSFQEMLDEIRRVFVCDPLKLKMLRRDICVDVEGVPLDWFKSHARVEFKRNMREIGYMNVHKRHGETLYVGEKPNQFRIYNKVAERLYRYAYMTREAGKHGGSLPSFRETFGHAENAVITRVERQYGGSQCGGTLRSLLMLGRTDPFSPLKFLPGTGGEASLTGMDCTTYWATKHLQTLTKENGIQYVRAHVSERVGSKNVKKTWERYVPFLAQANDEPEITAAMLNELYLQSIKRQMEFTL